MDQQIVAITPPATPPVQEPQTTDRPAWLPEKFKSPEDMAKAYSELESKLGKPAEPTKEPAKATEDPTKAPPADPKQAEIEKAVGGKEAFDKYAAEFSEKGEISPESYAELEAKGLPKSLVDSYVEGQKALAARELQGYYEQVGGQENFTKMSEWAAANLPKDQIDAYNDLTAKGTPAQVQMALRGLYSQYQAANGSSSAIHGQVPTQASTSSEGFRSTAEVVRAMNDPRYGNDPAYRDEVAAKLAKSSIM